MKLLKPAAWFVLIFWSCNEKSSLPILSPLDSPTSSLLQAISIVDENTAWISGHQANVLVTNDQGRSWKNFQYQDVDTLQFRDVHGFTTEKAILLSAGPGKMSRIITFEDESWMQNFIMQDSVGFLDCLDFWDEKRGIAYGDAIDEYPYILLTNDGGKSWGRAPTNNMPKAGAGEGGFAASGTCVSTGEGGTAWVATGAGGNCRVLITEDYGQSWKAVESPLIKGEAAGNTSVSFDGQNGFLTGGDLLATDQYTANTAFSTDGGTNWELSNSPKTKGAFYGGATSTMDNVTHVFACGPNGIDYTNNFGESWTTLDTLNYWAVALKDDFGYVSGRNGRILKISLPK